VSAAACVEQAAPYNHWGCEGCDGSRALTLADRELITGRSLTELDEDTGLLFCVDCLADLPPGFEALSHVCEPPAVVQVSDVVRYHGSLTEHYGTVWEVTLIDERGLILFDVDRALWNVHTGSVTVLRKGGQR
jgi:hypothetical protein